MVWSSATASLDWILGRTSELFETIPIFNSEVFYVNDLGEDRFDVAHRGCVFRTSVQTKYCFTLPKLRLRPRESLPN